MIAKSVTVVLGLSVCGISGYLLYLFLKKDEDDDYSDTINKASNFKMLRVPIPRDMVIPLLGPGGRTLQQMEEQSNTKIIFQDYQDAFGVHCIVRGTIEACHIAENLILEFVRNQPPVVSEDIFIPLPCIEMLRDKITEICSTSGAKVSADSDRSSPLKRLTIKGEWGLSMTVTKRVIAGTQEQISVAKSLLDKVVEKYQRSQEQIEATLAKREPRLPPKSGDSPKSIGSPKVERISPVPGNTLFTKNNYKYLFLHLVSVDFQRLGRNVSVKLVESHVLSERQSRS
mgnify:CR=1 FL=1